MFIKIINWNNWKLSQRKRIYFVVYSIYKFNYFIINMLYYAEFEIVFFFLYQSILILLKR